MPSLEQIRRQRRLEAEKPEASGTAERSDADKAVNPGNNAVSEVPAAEPETKIVSEPEAGSDAHTDSKVSEEPVIEKEPAESESVPALEEEPAVVPEETIQDAPEQSEVSEPVAVEPVVAQGEVPEETGDIVLEQEPEQEAVSEPAGQETEKPVKKVSGGKSRKERSKRGRKPVAQDFKEDGTVRVDLPSKLVAMARNQFPDASNNTEAVAAWMYAKSDKTMDVPDSVKSLAATYTGDQMSNLVKDVSERLAVLDSRTMKMQMLTDGRVQEMWYMIAYLMLERMDALAKTHMKDLDLSLPIFETLRSDINDQFRKVRNRQQLSDGRQIYQRKAQGKRSDMKN